MLRVNAEAGPCRAPGALNLFHRATRDQPATTVSATSARIADGRQLRDQRAALVGQPPPSRSRGLALHQPGRPGQVAGPDPDHELLRDITDIEPLFLRYAKHVLDAKGPQQEERVAKLEVRSRSE